jgi:hypothetical protein
MKGATAFPGVAMTKDEIAKTAARILIETQAIHFNVAKPYIFTSGWASPTYCDCRRLISFPRARAKAFAIWAAVSAPQDFAWLRVSRVSRSRAWIATSTCARWPFTMQSEMVSLKSLTVSMPISPAAPAACRASTSITC